MCRFSQPLGFSLRLISLCLSFSTLVACGGGGGGGGSNSSSKISSSSAVSSSSASSLSSSVLSSENTSSSLASSSSSTTPASSSISSTSSTSSIANSSNSSSSDSSATVSSSSSSLVGTVVDSAATIRQALTSAKAGDIIYVRGGTYAFTSTIKLTTSGSSDASIQLLPYPGDSSRPKFDFSAQSESSSNRGLELSGSYWYIKGIDIYRAGDNCMYMSGSNNTIEFSTFSECADTGLQLGGGASNNLILNCDSYYNADSTLENADGFAAKLDVGTGNKFVGCRAWQNLDDGWDGYLRPADDITTTYENCWAFKNGYLKNGNLGAGDGNGFKTGGSDGKDLRHNAIYKNCIAAGNSADGFDHNSNRGSVTLLNCAAHNNGNNINFSSTNIASSLTIKNTISFGATNNFNATAKDISNNSWQDGLQATDVDFESVDIAQLAAPRKADGSLPDIDYLKLKSSSPLIDKGVDVGLPFNGTAPDLGAFETSAP